MVKNIIAIILTFALLPIVSVTSSANFEPAVYPEAYDLLNQLGIAVTNTAINSETSSDKITRGEFTVLVMNAMNVRIKNADAAIFTDVPLTHMAYDAIMNAYKMGVVTGTGKNTFAPDERIETNQAVAMAVKALGDGELAEYSGGYPYGYLAVASRGDLLENVDLTSKFMTRGNAYQLIYNALHTEVATVLGYEDSYTLKSNMGVTMLELYHKISYIEDVIVADGLVSIAENNLCDEGEIRTSNMTFLVDFSASGSLVGKRARIYYTEDKGNYHLCALSMLENTSVTFTAQSIVEFNYKNGYYKVNTGEKETVFRIGDEYNTVYNNEALSVTDKNLMLPDCGFITLIDNNEDRIFDVVMVEEYFNVVFESYDCYNQIIFDRDNPEYNVHLGDYEKVISDIDDYTTLSKNTILTVTKSRDGNSVILKTGKDTVSGVLTEVNRDGTDSYVLDGVEYTASAHMRVSSDIFKSGQAYTFSPDAYGKIAYAILSDVKKGGYLVQFSTPSAFEKYKARIFNGALQEFDIADSVRLTTPEGTQKVSSERFIEIFNTYLPSDRIYVLYTYNSDKEISQVVLPKVVTTQEEYDEMGSYELYKMDYYAENWGSHGKIYKSTSYSIGNWLTLDPKTQVFEVPPETESISSETFGIGTLADYFINDQSFTVKSGNQGSKGKGEIEVYKAGNNGYTPNVLIYFNGTTGSANIRNDQTIAVVQNVKGVYDSLNNESKVAITYVQNGRSVTKNLADDDLHMMSQLKNTSYADLGLPSSVPADKTMLEPGDVIKFALNNNDEITSICLLFDAKSKTMCYSGTESFNRIFRLFSAKINIVDGNFAEYSCDFDNSRERLFLNGYRVVIVDNTGRDINVMVGSVGDITRDDIVVIHSRYELNGTMIVYKEHK